TSDWASNPWTTWYLYMRTYSWSSGLVWESTGEFTYSPTGGGTNNNNARKAAIADIDHDGQVEFIIPFMKGGSWNAFIAMYHVSGGSIVQECYTNFLGPYTYSFVASVQAFDFDLDGRLELVVGGYDYSVTNDYSPTLRVYNVSGGAFHLEQARDLPLSGNDRGVQGVKKIDQDKMILVGWNGTKNGPKEGFVMLYEQFPTGTFDGINSSTAWCVKGDFDADGSVELVTMNIVYSTTPNQIWLSAWEITPRSIVKKAEDFCIAANPIGKLFLVMMDYDDDGIREAIILRTTGSGDYYMTYLYAYNLTGASFISEYNQTLLSNSTDWSSDFDAGDFNGDGVDELIHVGTYCASPGVGNYQTHLSIWRFNGAAFTRIARTNWARSDPTYAGSCTLGDFDDDGVLEVLVTSDWASNPWTTWYLYMRTYSWSSGLVWESTGEFTYGPTGSGSNNNNLGKATIGDFDYDGELEFSLIYMKGVSWNAFLTTYRVSGGSIIQESSTNWIEGTGGSLPLSSTWFDYDQDGANEIIVVGMNYGTGVPNSPMLRVYNASAGTLNLERSPVTPVLGNNIVIQKIVNIEDEMLFITGYNGTYSGNYSGFTVELKRKSFHSIEFGVMDDLVTTGSYILHHILNGTDYATGTWTSPGTMKIRIDRLSVGLHWFNLTVWDGES
nr:VCBS repeat-containing protein [Candidatus Sigynarchaeota archaeon]